jgi:phosphatidylglycerophosphate synthase
MQNHGVLHSVKRRVLAVSTAVIWTRLHAVLLLSLCGVAGGLGRSWPIAAGALASFCAFIGLNARDWLGRRWVPNAVTAFRLLLICCLAAGPERASPAHLAAITAIAFALDGLDGWLARRFGGVSDAGALFDMECDALLVLLAEFELWQRGLTGAWILTTGLARYLYVLCVALVKPCRAPESRSQFARLAFAALVISLILAFVWRKPFGSLAAAAGTLVVSASFARSLRQAYGGVYQTRPLH